MKSCCNFWKQKGLLFDKNNIHRKLPSGNNNKKLNFKRINKNDFHLSAFLSNVFRKTGQFIFSFRFMMVTILLFSSMLTFSQQKKRVDIEQADFLEADDNIAPNAQRLVGNVRIRHKDVLMWCDSAYNYTGTNRVDAFGNVHINQGDTLDLYARKILYNGDNNFASAYQDVRLLNKNTTLYTDTLDFDMSANVGYYDNFGKIIDSTNTLTSIVGKYFIDEDLIHFYKDVVAYNDNYTLKSDTLVYNTTTGRVFIVGPTTIQDSANTLYAEDGWYDTKTGEAELLKNPAVSNETQQLKAKYIKYNEDDGKGRALGNVHIEDFENQMIVTGNTAEYNDEKEIATVTDSAVFIMYSEKDTLFLHADTLRTVPDTVEGEKLVMAYYGTRFFRTDLQGLCDSLIYFTKDSVVQLFHNPVVWSDNHQMSADLIEMKQNTDAPDEMHLRNNGFIISKLDSGMFDQIKGKEMVGYVVNNELNKINVDGNGQTLYYARQDEEIIGLNRVESSKISIHFNEGKIHIISFLKAPVGVLKPLFSLTREEKTLSGFDWKIDQRPLSKQDIFWHKTVPPEPESSVEPEAGSELQNK
ncbi:organic solvent tolerance protein OstA [Mariniphaga sediminis]|uniref:Organic solvent tolerance protein OstA n=1 Tax=Mariniphaga sediminis TaxID=1628158 RepID=A0A399CZ11_9BACT|nr:organic solvent tolerance protein OstA [Mariniphaga sediminis]